jgi:beta-glucosidase
MDMEGTAYENNLETLVSEGKINPALIDDSVRRILRIKFRLGLFDDPYRYCDENREKTEIYTPEHLAVARDAARKSIVLLKNEKNLLPLKKVSKGIAIIGPLADDKDTPIGNWRAQGAANSAVSFLEGIEKALGSKVQFEKGVELSIGKRTFFDPMTFNTTDRSGKVLR